MYGTYLCIMCVHVCVVYTHMCVHVRVCMYTCVFCLCYYMSIFVCLSVWVCVCVHIYTCICVWVYLCVSVSVYILDLYIICICTCLRMFENVSVCKYVRMYNVCTYVCVRMYPVCTCVCVYVYTYVCVYVCMTRTVEVVEKKVGEGNTEWSRPDSRVEGLRGNIRTPFK